MSLTRLLRSGAFGAPDLLEERRHQCIGQPVGSPPQIPARSSGRGTGGRLENGVAFSPSLSTSDDLTPPTRSGRLQSALPHPRALPEDEESMPASQTRPMEPSAPFPTPLPSLARCTCGNSSPLLCGARVGVGSYAVTAICVIQALRQTAQMSFCKRATAGNGLSGSRRRMQARVGRASTQLVGKRTCILLSDEAPAGPRCLTRRRTSRRKLLRAVRRRRRVAQSRCRSLRTSTTF